VFYVFKAAYSLNIMYLRTKGKKVVSTGLGVIGDIGKKTYNILLEDDEDSDAAGKTNVCILFVLIIDCFTQHTGFFVYVIVCFSFMYVD